MKRLGTSIALAWLCGCGGGTSTPTAVPAPASGPAQPAGGVFGVNASAGRRPDIPAYLSDLGVSWIRVNASLDGDDPDLAALLSTGASLILTLVNRDPANGDTRYGSLRDWPNAGFPYVSRAAYQQRIRESLAPVLPFLAAGRQVLVQCENEVGDAALSPDARYWRGTTDQYLLQLAALSDAVRSLSPQLLVGLTSFTSEGLDTAIDPGNARHDFVSQRLGSLLAESGYDAADLHFYGCVEDIPAKIRWVRERLPAGRQFVSTENGGPDSRCPTTPLTWARDPARFEQLQAQQVPARLSACADNGGSVCLWFSLLDLQGETEVFNRLGLLDPRVTPPARKLAYDAFKAFAAGRR